MQNILLDKAKPSPNCGIFVSAIIFCIYISAISNLNAQSNDTCNNLLKNHIIAKASISSLLLTDILNLNYGMLSFSAEKSITPRNSISSTIGYVLNYGESKGWSKLDANSIHGFSGKFEYRHYNNNYSIIEPAAFLFWPLLFQFNSQKKELTGYYYAADISGQYLDISRHEVYIKGYDKLNYTLYQPNDYMVNRKSISLYLKLGYQAVKASRIVVDQSFGIGLKYINSNSKNKYGDNNDYEFPYNKPLDSGQKCFFSLIYNLNIGFDFCSHNSK